MSEQITPQLKSIEDAFQMLVWEPLVSGVAASFKASHPWVNSWPLSPIFDGMVKVFSFSTYAALRLTVDITAIKFLNMNFQLQFEKQFQALQLVANEKGIESDEFAKAKESAKASLAKFVSFNK